MRANKLVPVCADTTLYGEDCPLCEAEPGRPLRGMLRVAVLPHRRPQMRAVAEGERQLGATSCRIGSMRGGLDAVAATPAVVLHTVGRSLAQQVWRNR